MPPVICVLITLDPPCHRMVEDTSDVILYTSTNCAPCVVMKRKLEEIGKQIPFSFSTVNIDEIPSDDRSKLRVAPVLKIVGMNEHIVGDVDIDDLRNVLMRSLLYKQ